MDFKIKSDYKLDGDQPQAVDKLTAGILAGHRFQTLLGATGTGKTFTMAHVIERVQKPTLVMAHNKTLVAQLCSEFREFFPDNAVEYFVSYYDYYQPEAYIPQTDTYIEKDSSINDEIDRLRHSATQALLERRDVIVVASVSCIYGLGSPEEYKRIILNFQRGQEKDREECLHRLIDMQFTRNSLELQRGTFRVRGDVLEIQPIDEEIIVRVEFFGDEIEKITLVDPLTGEVLGLRDSVTIFPASHFVTSEERLEAAIVQIEEELKEQVARFTAENKLIEAQRIEQRTRFDIEMMRELGYCSGIENYSRFLDGREPGTAPNTLYNYFPDDFLVILDESHQTIPQLHGMYHGDMARKSTLVDFGFRLPSAKDNRPLKFHEWLERVRQVVFVSATPGPFEKQVSVANADGSPVPWNNGRLTIDDRRSAKNDGETPLVSESVEPSTSNELPSSIVEQPASKVHPSSIVDHPASNVHPSSIVDRPSSETGLSPLIAEQIIRPTGLIDPEVILRPTKGQIDDLISEIRKRTEKKERVLVTTLTKRMAEDLTEYLEELNIKVHYLHSDIKTLERTEILRDLRTGVYDVVVGINLLREGLDLPEVSLVAILDADKEGFLRSDTSLIQTIGRAARNVSGQVIMYADNVTGSMQRAIDETNRRRAIQVKYNEENGITPTTVIKAIRELISAEYVAEEKGTYRTRRPDLLTAESMPLDEVVQLIAELEVQMKAASKNLDFEQAAVYRDEILELKRFVPSHAMGGAETGKPKRYQKARRAR